MSDQHRPRRRRGLQLRFGRRAMIGAGVLAVFAAGGVAWSAIPDPGTAAIHGCYNRTSGALRVIDPSKGQSCATGEAALNWGGAGMHWRGGWVSTTAYGVNDTVSFNGSTYLAKVASTGSQPPGPSWAVVSDKPYANVFSQSNETNPGTFPVAFGSNPTVIASTTGLPAGNFALSAQVTLFMDNGAQDIQCFFEDNHGNALNGYAETSGPPDGSSSGVVQTLSLVDAVTAQSSGTQIRLMCATANGADPSASEAVSASISAIQTGTTFFNGTRFGSQ